MPARVCEGCVGGAWRAGRKRDFIFSSDGRHASKKSRLSSLYVFYRERRPLTTWLSGSLMKIGTCFKKFRVYWKELKLLLVQEERRASAGGAAVGSCPLLRHVHSCPQSAMTFVSTSWIRLLGFLCCFLHSIFAEQSQSSLLIFAEELKISGRYLESLLESCE